MTSLEDPLVEDDDNDDNLSMGSESSEESLNGHQNDRGLVKQRYKTQQNRLRSRDNDDDDYTTHTETTDPHSNCATDGTMEVISPASSSNLDHGERGGGGGMYSSRAALFQAHLLEENKKSAQVDREKRAFKAYKNTVLFMMKNLKRPDGKDDTEWYEAVERQAKAVIEAVDSKKEGEDGIEEGGDEWFKAVETKAREIIQEVGKRDVVGGDTEWGQGEWNDVVEKKVKAVLEEKKVEELKKLEIQLEEEKRLDKLQMEKEKLQMEKAKEKRLEAMKKEKEMALEKKKIEDKKKADEKMKIDNKKKEVVQKIKAGGKKEPVKPVKPVKYVPLRRTTRNPACILHTFPKFQYIDPSSQNENDENKLMMMEYKTTGWLVSMAKWKTRRTAYQMEQYNKCGCPDCKRDLEKLVARRKQ